MNSDKRTPLRSGCEIQLRRMLAVNISLGIIAAITAVVMSVMNR